MQMICNTKRRCSAPHDRGHVRSTVARSVASLVCLLAMGSLTCHAQSAKPKVVTSFLPAYCLAMQVGGERVEVACLAGGANDAHDLQLSPQEIRHFRGSTLLIVNGLQLEPWVQKVLDSMPDHPPKVIELAAQVGSQVIYGPTPLGGHFITTNNWKSKSYNNSHPAQPAPNAHFWLDPRLMMMAVTNLVVAFCQMDAAHAPDYARNGAVATARLAELDARLGSQLAPLKRRSFVTQHDAFAYLARRYDLDLVGVLETVSGVEPTPRYLERLLAVMRASHVSVLFVTPRSTSRLATQLANDNHLRTGLLDPLETGELAWNAYEKGMDRNAHELTTMLK